MSRPIPADPLIGQILLDQFEVVEKVGKGGWATVYAAYQASMDRRVAIKVLHREHIEEEEPRARFMMEGRSASRLNHPNIVRPWLLGQLDDGTPFMVMDFVEGQTLWEALKECPSLSVGRVLKISKQLSSALEEAYVAGVVHRDLKPSNIFLSERGREVDVVRLMDFGIAKVLDESLDQESLTRSGDILGTPAFMSPEQAAGQDVDHRADLYSFGGLIFKMLVGEPPFVEATLVGVLSAHLHKTPLAPSRASGRRDIPESLDSLVLDLLQKRPGDRPATALVVSHRLDQIAMEIGLEQGHSTLPGLRPTDRNTLAGDTERAPKAAGSGSEPLVDLARTATIGGAPVAREIQVLINGDEGELEASQFDRAMEEDEEERGPTIRRRPLSEMPATQAPSNLPEVESADRPPVLLCGTGEAGFGGEGLRGAQVALRSPTGLTVDPIGGIFVVDTGNHCVRTVDPQSGEVRTVIGCPEQEGFSGDEGPAHLATFCEPRDLICDGEGNVFIADQGNRRVRAVDARTGVVMTILGNGEMEATPDGTPAGEAALVPAGLAFGPDGALYVADSSNHRIWRVDPQSGQVGSLCGTGEPGDEGDGGALAWANLNGPEGIAFDAMGRLWVADRGNRRLRVLDLRRDDVSSVGAGDAGVGDVSSVAVGGDGWIYVTDAGGGRVLMVHAEEGELWPLATGLVSPSGLCLDHHGSVLVTDSGRHRVWVILP